MSDYGPKVEQPYTTNDDDDDLSMEESYLEDVSLHDEENRTTTKPPHETPSIITTTTTLASSSRSLGAGVPLQQQRRADWKAARAAAHHYQHHPMQPFGCLGVLLFVRGLHDAIRYCRYLEQEQLSQQQQQQQQSNDNNDETPPQVLSWKKFHHQQKQQQRRPYFTYALLTVCTLVLVASLIASGGFERGNAMLGPDSDTLQRFGALSSKRLLAPHSEWYRLVAAVFLHAGLVHWAANAIVVVVVGPMLERLHGSAVTGALFFASAVAANLAVALLSPFTVSMGCSGGVCAWFGVCVTEGLLHWPHLGNDNDNNNTKVKAAAWLVLEISALVAFGWFPWVDNVAHCFGLLFGACWAAVVVPTAGVSSFLLLPQRPRHRCLHQCLRGGAALLATCTTLFALWYLTIVMSFSGGGDMSILPCRHYCQTIISCAPWQYDTCGDPCHFALGGYQGSLVTVYDDNNSSSNGGSLLLTAQLDCPYGETADVVTRIDAIMDQDDGGMIDADASIDWTQLCRTYCDL